MSELRPSLSNKNRAPLTFSQLGTGLISRHRWQQNLRFRNFGRNSSPRFSSYFSVGKLDVPRETENSQRPDPVPVHIELIPGKAVTRQVCGCVMIVVPSFPERQHRHPEIVFGHITCEEPLRSPHMRCGNHEPSGMETDSRSQEKSPKEARPTTDREDKHTEQ